jgi:hypothetical protein
VAKRKDASLREGIAGARDQWAQLQHARHNAALYESRAMRAANRKAIKPQPTQQAKLVAWHLTYRVRYTLPRSPKRKFPKRANASTCRSKPGGGKKAPLGCLRKFMRAGRSLEDSNR